MNVKYLAATLMKAALLVVPPAFAQKATTRTQHTRGGGDVECATFGSLSNASPLFDSDRKRRTRDLTLSPYRIDEIARWD